MDVTTDLHLIKSNHPFSVLFLLKLSAEYDTVKYFLLLNTRDHTLLSFLSATLPSFPQPLTFPPVCAVPEFSYWSLLFLHSLLGDLIQVHSFKYYLSIDDFQIRSHLQLSLWAFQNPAFT